MSSSPEVKATEKLASARAKVAMAENEVTFRKEQLAKALEAVDTTKDELAALEAEQERAARAGDEALADFRLERGDDEPDNRPLPPQPDPGLGPIKGRRRPRRDPQSD